MPKTSYTLIMPGLFESTEQIQRRLAPALVKWLSGTQPKPVSRSYYDLLLAAFNYPQADYDFAKLRALADGLDPDAIWLCADPLHVAVDVTHIYSLGSAYLALQAEEVKDYVDAINDHLSADGLALVAADSLRWYIKLPEIWQATYHYPDEIFAKTIRDKMPQGVDGGRARALFNAMQMILHDHPCNVRRRNSGQPTVDALWLWGGGAMFMPMQQSQWECVKSNDPLALALARIQGLDTADLADDISGTVLITDTRFQFSDAMDAAYQYIPQAVYPFLKKLYVGNGLVYEKLNVWERLWNKL